MLDKKKWSALEWFIIWQEIQCYQENIYKCSAVCVKGVKTIYQVWKDYYNVFSVRCTQVFALQKDFQRTG